MKLGTYRGAALLLAGSLVAAAAVAQTATEAPSATGLNIPANPQFFGNEDPTVRKATAIVNGAVITGSDVDHRVALVVMANGGRIPAEELQRVREQVLRNLVDETLQIQAAEAAEIKIEPKEIETYYARSAKDFGKTPKELSDLLRAAGSSEASFKRQLKGQIAWARLQARQIEPFVNVGEDEVQGIIDRLKASKGQQEYKIAEIFLAATPENQTEVGANANRILEQLRNGASFTAYARQFSEASTAAVGGDLGWVRPEQIPEPLAAAAQKMRPGQVSAPIPVPGGVSIIALQDTRQVLVADPRDAILSLKQLSINFPAGMARTQVEPLLARLNQTAQTMGGCGRAEEAAMAINAEVVSSDQVRVRDLPPPLQEMLLKLNIGQATPPFGSLQEGVRVLVLCGRDDPETTDGPSFDQVYAQLNDERVNRRARRYLRDLRRDAVVDYR